MHKHKDQMAKRIAVEIFDPYGQAQAEKQVPSPDAQSMDLWYEPGKQPAKEPLPSYLRLPLRMAGQAAQFEFFSTIPDSDQVRDIHRKQLDWNQHRRLQARRRKQPMPALFPAWVITPGQPSAYFRRRHVHRAKGWPRGVYWTDEESQLWFVVVSELERTRQTLVLRLLGSERSRAQALEDIVRIPEDDLEWPRLSAVVAQLRTAVEHDKTIPRQERAQFMTAARAEQIRRDEQLRSESELKGRTEEARMAIYDLCEVLKIPVTSPRRKQAEKMDLDALHALRQHLKRYQSWPQS